MTTASAPAAGMEPDSDATVSYLDGLVAAAAAAAAAAADIVVVGMGLGRPAAAAARWSGAAVGAGTAGAPPNVAE